MASKRNMYKPATLASTGARTKRTPLAQGHLVTTESHVTQTQQHSQIPDSVGENTPVVHQAAQASLSDGGVTRNLASIQSHKHAVQAMVEKMQSPRRELSRAMMSPHPPPHTDVLDLSDPESDPQEVSTALHQITNPVLLVDASSSSGDQSEVAIRLGIESSPARVVCHAAGPTATRGEVNQVAMTTVNSMSSSGDHSVGLFKSYADSSTGHIGDGEETFGRETVAKTLFPAEGGCDTSEATGDEQDDEPPTKMAVSISSVPSVIKSLAKTSEEMQDKVKKKKKVSRVVNSRYMQEAHKGPMKATDRTAVNEVSQPKSQSMQHKSRNSSVNTSKKTTPSSKKTTPSSKKVPTKKRSTPSPCGRTTPSNRRTGGVVSTPNSADLPEPSMDMSAIPHQGGKHSSLLGNSDVGSFSSQTSKSDSKTHKRHEEGSQWELEVMYSEYLQAVHLDARARHSFLQEERNVMAQLHGLWEINEGLSEQLKKQIQLVDEYRHDNALDNTLDVQLEGLSQAVTALPLLDKQHRVLSAALHTTTHQLKSRGILIPDDEHALTADLEAGLRESEALLRDLGDLTQGKVQHAVNYANTISLLDETTRAEITNINRGHELVSAATSLAIQECGLRILDMP